jgi:hypothetical protein
VSSNTVAPGSSVTGGLGTILQLRSTWHRSREQAPLQLPRDLLLVPARVQELALVATTVGRVEHGRPGA